MESKRKLTPVQQAYQRSEEARHAIVGSKWFIQTMEVTEDKCGIVWERYLMGHSTMAHSIILIATPYWWDIMVPVSGSNKIQDTLEALDIFLIAKAGPREEDRTGLPGYDDEFKA